jgi:hypothetical protein
MAPERSPGNRPRCSRWDLPFPLSAWPGPPATASATFMAFDVLVADGVDVCARPWDERRQVLRDLYELSTGTDAWRVSTAFVDGPGLLAATAAWAWRAWSPNGLRRATSQAGAPLTGVK